MLYFLWWKRRTESALYKHFSSPLLTWRKLALALHRARRRPFIAPRLRGAHYVGKDYTSAQAPLTWELGQFSQAMRASSAGAFQKEKELGAERATILQGLGRRPLQEKRTNVRSAHVLLFLFPSSYWPILRAEWA